MAAVFIDNIDYSGRNPDFTRQEYATLADMKVVKKTKMPEMYMAYCLETRKYYIYNKQNEVDEVLGLWREMVLGGGGGGTGGGSSSLTTDLTSNIEVGGIKSGTSYVVGTELEKIIKDMLVKYVDPKISVSITPSTSYYNKWDTIDTLLVKVDATKGTSDIAKIQLFKDSTQLGEDKLDDFEYTISDPITDSFTIKATVTDSQGKSGSASKSVKFILPFYKGTSSTHDLTVLDDSTLTAMVEAKGNKEVKYTCNGEYIVFAYDATYGNLSSIMDSNGFENLSDFDVLDLTLTKNEVDYNYKVYITNTVKICENFSYIFKF